MMKSSGGSRIKDLIESDYGQILVSVILGLGLATLLRKACKDNRCVVITGPKPADVDDVYYKYKDECYKYTPEEIAC